MLCPGLVLVEKNVERARGCSVIVTAGVAPERPFNPSKRNTEEKGCDKVRDDESASTICSSLHGEAEKVSETDSRACDSQNHAQFGAPIFTISVHLFFLENCENKAFAFKQ